MTTALDRILTALEDSREDFEDGYSGATKVSATRARKALKEIKDAAHEARKELLAISKGEAPASPVDLSVFDAPQPEEEE